ncbi:MAG: hypothetical protein N2Z69_03050 [Methylophilaceae bacterium]|nr:hypothetical protein [Methylophilaceae bacterium]
MIQRLAHEVEVASESIDAALDLSQRTAEFHIRMHQLRDDVFFIPSRMAS